LQNVLGMATGLTLVGVNGHDGVSFRVKITKPSIIGGGGGFKAPTLGLPKDSFFGAVPPKLSSHDSKFRGFGDRANVAVFTPHLDQPVIRHGFEGARQVAWLAPREVGE